MAFRFTDNGEFRGQTVFSNIVLSAGCVTDASVQAAALIASSKLEQRNRQVYSQESAAAATDGVYVVHVAGAAGNVESFGAGCVVANIGNSVVAVDLLKNGNSILSAAVSIGSGNAARAVVAGTVSAATLAAGDVLEIEITGTAGTGTLGKGVFTILDVRETPS